MARDDHDTSRRASKGAHLRVVDGPSAPRSAPRTEPKPPSAPRGLLTRGRAFWRTTVADFELDEHELRLLHEACRMLDTIDELDAQMKADGVMAAGSQGQPVLHPAVAERRQQQLALARLMATLNLDATDDTAGLVREASAKARAAADARWSKSEKARRG